MPKKLEQCQMVLHPVIYKGITFSMAFTYTDVNDFPINLTGKVVHFKLRRNNEVLTYTNIPTANGSEVSLTAPLAGKFKVVVADEDTALLKTGTYRWWLELHYSGAIVLITSGDLTVSEV